MSNRNPLFLCGLLALLASSTFAADQPDERFPLFSYFTGNGNPTMVTYTPSELDPRNDANQRRLPTSSIRADLEALRPAFDGLILYGYHEACTPRIASIATDLKYRAIILAVWDPKSTSEIDGVAELARQFEKHLLIGVLLGNEGLTFSRYEAEDLRIGLNRLRYRLPKSIPVGTSEPLVGYKHAVVREFGDFLAPNIHPVFDRKDFGAEEAATWAREQALKLARETKKPVMLKETGFPHGGQATYSAASQRDFWAAYVKPGTVVRGDAWVFHGVAFEAFDLPWKSEESKLEIEKSWGLLSARRQPYPSFEVWKSIRGKSATTP